MSTTTHTKVVVGYDFSKSAHAAMYRALALATRAPFHELHFVCVIHPHEALAALPAKKVTYEYAERVQKEMASEIGTELREANANNVHFTVHARIGKPVDEILDLAREIGADLIIVGCKGLTGVERLVLGSVSERVVREAGCAVMVARPKKYDYVELAEVKEVESHPHYVPPHRYYYEENRLNVRPIDWPLP